MPVMQMKKSNWKPYALWILGTEAVGALSGFLSRGGMDRYTRSAAKPPLSPPPLVFPIVWSLLYGLMGYGAARVWLSPPSRCRSRGLNLFAAQLAVNFFWSLFFFNAEAYGFSFFWLLLLWTLALGMLLSFRQADTLAGALQIPYLLWLAFALYLNLGVWIRNR